MLLYFQVPVLLIKRTTDIIYSVEIWMIGTRSPSIDCMRSLYNVRYYIKTTTALIFRAVVVNIHKLSTNFEVYSDLVAFLEIFCFSDTRFDGH
jgi:hypothetical protein